MMDVYHYTECGLDNVYLLNGFKVTDGKYGPGVRIEDVDGLHRAIGTYLATSKPTLSGREMKFLRHRLGLTQSKLARRLRKSDLTIARWEKKGSTPEDAPPPESQALMRIMYLEHIGGDRRFTDLLDALAELQDARGDLFFSEKSGEWEKAA